MDFRSKKTRKLWGESLGTLIESIKNQKVEPTYGEENIYQRLYNFGFAVHESYAEISQIQIAVNIHRSFCKDIESGISSIEQYDAAKQLFHISNFVRDIIHLVTILGYHIDEQKSYLAGEMENNNLQKLYSISGVDNQKSTAINCCSILLNKIRDYIKSEVSKTPNAFDKNIQIHPDRVLSNLEDTAAILFYRWAKFGLSDLSSILSEQNYQAFGKVAFQEIDLIGLDLLVKKASPDIKKDIVLPAIDWIKSHQNSSMTFNKLTAYLHGLNKGPISEVIEWLISMQIVRRLVFRPSSLLQTGGNRRELLSVASEDRIEFLYNLLSDSTTAPEEGGTGTGKPTKKTDSRSLTTEEISEAMDREEEWLEWKEQIEINGNRAIYSDFEEKKREKYKKQKDKYKYANGSTKKLLKRVRDIESKKNG